MNGTGSLWPAIAAARRGDRSARVPFLLGNERVGSVARANLQALREMTSAGWLVGESKVCLRAADTDAAFAQMNARLRSQGLIVAWRDEAYPVFADDATRELARIERASSRFWGTLTLGAHANGWVAGPDGRPAALWIARRALTKATDPGMHDNLIGGGVPAGQSPWQTLQREGFEEAGLDAALLRTARPGRVVRLERDIPEGWQFECLHVFDLELQPDRVPVNQDGEVDRFDLLPVSEAIALARGGTMTVDASLATLDFALRHGLLGGEAEAIAAAADALWCAGAAVSAG